jgi:hypothetical protein
MFRRWFLDHPRSVGETYAGHFRIAFAFGAEIICAGLACWVHALFPSLFTSTASRAVGDLHKRMSVRGAGANKSVQVASGR